MVLLGKFRHFIKIGKKKYKVKIHDSPIHHKGKHQKFWEIFVTLLPEGSVLRASEIIFSAEKIQSLVEFKKYYKNTLSYEMCFTFFKYIGKQLLFLEKEDITVPFFSMDDFIVIDEKYFLFINTDKLFPINEDNHITIGMPFDKELSHFFSPELKIMDTIPNDIYFTSGLYSLAKLVSFLLTNKTNVTAEMKEKGLYWNQIDENCVDYKTAKEGVSFDILLLESIFYTKLYWALKRCFQVNPRQRYFLII